MNNEETILNLIASNHKLILLIHENIEDLHKDLKNVDDHHSEMLIHHEADYEHRKLTTSPLAIKKDS